MSDAPTPRPRPRRARVAALFQALLGAIFLAVFLSLAIQLPALIGSRGLLPIAEALARVPEPALSDLWNFPTLLWMAHSDRAIIGCAVAGALFSLALLARLGARSATFLLWLLFLSCITAGRDFFQYQWDNLLLEASFLALFLPAAGGLRALLSRAPAGGEPGTLRRPAHLREPSSAIVFLFRWLLFRLLFESAWAKIASGDEHWWDLTAMSYYYETAPLPSWGGWLIQQAPLWVHQGSVLVTFLVELLLAPLAFAPRPLRLILFAANVGFQASIFLTSNYGYFNALSFAISLFLLEDRDLQACARLLGRAAEGGGLKPYPPAAGTGWSRQRGVIRRIAWGVLVSFIVSASLVEAAFYFAPRSSPKSAGFLQHLAPWRFYSPLRIVNGYHLFPGILRERHVIEITGSRDGVSWLPYHFRHAPGDPRVAPPMTWLHNPRFAFHYSFLPLNRRRDLEYFNTLTRRLCCDREAVAGLLVTDPFQGEAPVALRFDFYRYRFSDRARRRDTGEYWMREFLGSHQQILTCRCASEGEVGEPRPEGGGG